MRTLAQEIAVGLKLGEGPEALAERVRSHLEQEKTVELMEKKGIIESYIDPEPEPSEQEIAALGKLLAQEDESTDGYLGAPSRARVFALRKAAGCTYPDCDCAVSFPENYRPSKLTECPRFMDEIGGFDALTD